MIDKTGMDNLLSQLRAASTAASGHAFPPSNNAKAAGGVDFGEILKTSLDQVNSMQQEAGKLARAFETGAPNVNLHDVMISLQKANVSFQTMVQVRNRLISAYHDIMNMQV